MNNSWYAEKCLVVKKSDLEKSGYLTGYPKVNGVNSGLRKLVLHEVKNFITFVESHKEFRPRFGEDGVEKDSSWQQIVVYQVVKKNNLIFVYQRKIEDPKYPEKRLEGKISVGVGGHVDPTDLQINDALYRELLEELVISADGREVNIRNLQNHIVITPVALLKDETDSVGKVHLGLISSVEIVDTTVTVEIRKNHEIIFGRFMTIDEYKSFIAQKKYIPENWTNLVMSSLDLFA